MKSRLTLAWLLFGLPLITIPFSVLLNTSASVARSAHLSAEQTPAIPAAPSATFTVNNNGDLGSGTLRKAIDDANLTAGADLINFTPGLSIVVGSTTGTPLPDITEAVTIDAGSSKVELNGSAAGASANGLTLLAPGVIVRGLVINRFSGSGIVIQSGNCIIQGNFIGTDIAAASALPNAEGGVLIDSAGNLIGGTAITEGNIISGNIGFGIELSSAEANNNTIQGNLIGTDGGGGPLGNSGSGIRTLGSAGNNTIGGTVAGAGNTIAFNGVSGVNIFGGANNAILGNSIFSNSNLGIDLIDDGAVTPNDSCDGDGGGNEQQNFPVLSSANSGVGGTTIIGSLDSTVARTFRIEFFSSPTCDGSGNGEGQTFIGATTVNTPPSDCFVSFNAAFPSAVPLGSVITATATDSLNNTSEFSACVTVVAAPSCTLTCPPDFVRFTSPTATACGTVVTFSPETSSGCGVITCAPASGSVFAVGTTKVLCGAAGGDPSCSFSVTVFDDTPPVISCSTGVSIPLPADRSSAVVNYPAPTATDNCSLAGVTCVPPSGSTFPAGSTLVTCTAVDASENASRCAFFVTVLDGQLPVIRCPANVSAALPAGQTSAVVNYPAPTVTDNFPGVNVVCTPASGSSFPAGSTTVNCTATDSAGNKASCSFVVGVGGPQAKVTIAGNKASVEFAADPTRKAPKPKNNPCSSFTIENIGFGPLVLTFDSIARTGGDVDSGRITDPNDTRFFSLNLANQSLVPLDIGAVVTLQPGQVQNFCAKFAALIPALAGKTSGLAAGAVLPDAVTSKIVFRQNGGANIAVPILARVSTAVVLVNLTNPRAPAEVTFTRSGDDITVSYAVFDSNLDVSRSKYEFLNAGGQVIAGPFEIDLAGPVRSANLVKGQSFSVDQRFTGANDNPDVVGVRVTVFDGETNTVGGSSSAASISSASLQLMNRKRRVTLYPPDVKLRP